MLHYYIMRNEILTKIKLINNTLCVGLYLYILRFNLIIHRLLDLFILHIDCILSGYKVICVMTEN